MLDPNSIALMLSVIPEPTWAELEARVDALEDQIAAEQDADALRRLKVILWAILKAMQGMPVTE
jgi:hypothetical protein